MKRILLIAAFLTGCLAASGQDKAMLDNFKEPPHDARPRVWWHWMNANITKEGIRKDLLWMDSAGIAGFHNFDAGLETPQIVDRRLPYMTEEWKEAFNYALDLADSLGMEVTIASSPGWSETGGPWVSREDAMKKITWRDTVVCGGTRFKGALPEPIVTCGDYQYHLRFHSDPHKYDFYKDLAVFAVRLSDNDLTMEELGVKPTLEERCWTYEFPRPTTIRSYSIGMEDWNYGKYGYAIECSEDGEVYRTISPCLPDVNAVMKSVDIPATTARFFRLRQTGGGEWIVTHFSLSPMTRVNFDSEKAGFVTSGSMREFHPTPETDDPTPMSDIIEISRHYRNGVLDWKVPEGRWKIYRFGYNLTGKPNSPASPEATGLEVDKLDPKAVTRYWDNYLKMYDDASNGRLGKVITHVMIDSYEAKWPTWTGRMREEFKARRGYDMWKWMPALTGLVIDSSASTEEFLSDWRLTIGELTVENHYDIVNGILDRYGMKRYTESQEAGRAFNADGMDVKRKADIPMSAFWIKDGNYSSYSMSDADIRESASIAHIYGQKVVAAESFTTNGLSKEPEMKAYVHSPSSLKPAADAAMAAGLSRFVIHCSVHQPTDVIPGISLGKYGQWFNRHDTWSHEAKVWTDYLARSSWMLQQGKGCSDIAYYYGESTNITARFKLDYPQVPFGYNFDFVSRDILLNVLKTRDGKLVTDTGMEYSVLVIDNEIRYFSDEVRARLDEIRAAGIPVVAPSEALGALRGKGILPEFVIASPFPEPTPYDNLRDIRYVHRTLDGGELFWVANISPVARVMDVQFKVTGKKPRILHADSGIVEDASYRISDGYTTVRLDMARDDAQFVIFTEDTDDLQYTVPTTLTSLESVLDGEWIISFQQGRGAPVDGIKSPLRSLDSFDEPGIRYFSGTATYRKEFTLDRVPEGRTMIDLGEVHHMARVRVNGKDLGLVWKSPYRVDATGSLHKGANVIEIDVTNQWVNRLIGDAQDGAVPITYTAVKYYGKDSATLPAGLVGPVRITAIKQ
ncbi:MAG: glycoside hydrolase family 2 [Bacteroidales bacterium]|nr:glycoside hydrolase family 2 [Bacteroidales bacterium]